MTRVALTSEDRFPAELLAEIRRLWPSCGDYLARCCAVIASRQDQRDGGWSEAEAAYDMASEFYHGPGFPQFALDLVEEAQKAAQRDMWGMWCHLPPVTLLRRSRDGQFDVVWSLGTNVAGQQMADYLYGHLYGQRMADYLYGHLYGKDISPPGVAAGGVGEEPAHNPQGTADVAGASVGPSGTTSSGGSAGSTPAPGAVPADEGLALERGLYKEDVPQAVVDHLVSLCAGREHTTGFHLNELARLLASGVSCGQYAGYADDGGYVPATDGLPSAHQIICREANRLLAAEEPQPAVSSARPGDGSASDPSGPGVKFDGGKRQWGLVPWGAMEEMVKVLEFGARKYSADNWKRVPDLQNRYREAAMRHLVALMSGEQTDLETGLHHGAHLMCCAAFLVQDDVDAAFRVQETDDGEIPF